MSTAADKKTAKSKSSDREPKGIEQAYRDFETLNFTYGKASNIVRFKDTAFNICLKELGQVARVIRNTHRHIPPNIPDPEGNNPFSVAHESHGAKKTAYLRQISNREHTLAELRSKEPQLFAHIWGNMSKESRAQVERTQQQAMDYYGT